jgi:hypothetical protein
MIPPDRFHREFAEEEDCYLPMDLIEGDQIYHNYIRPHWALDGETPADKAGITVKGSDKWLTIIQRASSNKPRHGAF